MRHCEVCGKGSKMVGHRTKLRGHYNPTNLSRKYPNLQKYTTAKGEKFLACVQCIKTFSKLPRVKKARTSKVPAAAAAK